jgi:hypothetical protein
MGVEFRNPTAIFIRGAKDENAASSDSYLFVVDGDGLCLDDV